MNDVISSHNVEKFYIFDCSVTPGLITAQVICNGRFCHISGGQVLVLSLQIISLSNTFQHPFEGPHFFGVSGASTSIVVMKPAERSNECATARARHMPFSAGPKPLALTSASAVASTRPYWVKVNRPGFTGDFFVPNLCDFIKGVHACMEGVLHFLRRSVADGAV